MGVIELRIPVTALASFVSAMAYINAGTPLPVIPTRRAYLIFDRGIHLHNRYKSDCGYTDPQACNLNGTKCNETLLDEDK